MTSLATDRLPDAGKYLTFLLEKERYSVPVLKVREIMRMSPVTSVPRMPVFIKGVINLRGKIIPVIDLRERFGLPQALDLERICVIVVQFETVDGHHQLMGMIVDVVEEVSQFNTDDLELSPDFGGCIDTRFITGMAKTKGSVKTLLNIDRLLNHSSQLELREVVQNTPKSNNPA